MPQVPVPITAIDDSPRCWIPVNEDWCSAVVGFLSKGLEDFAWQGDSDDVEYANSQIARLIDWLEGCLVQREFAVVKHSTSSGVDAGGIAATTWTKRPLNDYYLQQTWLGLSSNEITLQPGNYLISYSFCSYLTGRTRYRLIDKNPGVPIDYSHVHNSAAAGTIGQWAIAQPYPLIIDQAHTYYWEQYSLGANVTNGMGKSIGISGAFEEYARILIERVS